MCGESIWAKTSECDGKMKQGLSLRVSQHLALTPQLQQSIRLLQLSTLELNQEIDQMLDDNPFLEKDLEAAEREAVMGRLSPAGAVADLKDAALVIEVIVEKLEPKQALLRELDALLPADALIASNTSSISITALANGMTTPRRLVGMHFFNPVPLMKLVEVVWGAETDPSAAQAIEQISRRWGKAPVHAKSTPGFIVNRIARPYYAETLQLLQEQAGSPALLDRALRGAGFRMGPCELMDLIGHDTNYLVTQSVFEANYGDKRYQPSLVQKALVDGGADEADVKKKFDELMEALDFFIHRAETPDSCAPPPDSKRLYRWLASAAFSLSAVRLVWLSF